MNINELELTSKALNEASDEFTKILIEIQKRIDELNLGVEAFVEITLEETSSQVWLGYGKVLGKGWSLFIGNINGTRERTPLLECTRAVRIQTIERIPTLVTILRVKAEDTLHKVNKAKLLAKNYLEELNSVVYKNGI
jgi:hypothetical protein